MTVSEILVGGLALSFLIFLVGAILVRAFAKPVDPMDAPPSEEEIDEWVSAYMRHPSE